MWRGFISLDVDNMMYITELALIVANVLMSPGPKAHWDHHTTFRIRDGRWLVRDGWEESFTCLMSRWWWAASMGGGRLQGWGWGSHGSSLAP